MVEGDEELVELDAELETSDAAALAQAARRFAAGRCPGRVDQGSDRRAHTLGPTWSTTDVRCCC